MLGIIHIYICPFFYGLMPLFNVRPFTFIFENGLVDTAIDFTLPYHFACLVDLLFICLLSYMSYIFCRVLRPGSFLCYLNFLGSTISD